MKIGVRWSRNSWILVLLKILNTTKRKTRKQIGEEVTINMVVH